MRAKELQKIVCRKLRQAGIENADLESRIMLKNVLGLTDADLISMPERVVAPEESAQLEIFLQRRLAGEPLSRILGQREFYGLSFIVTPDVLDPRPDTETLVDAVLARFKDVPPHRILDLGTGTGCVLIALLKAWPQTQGVAADISESALDVARKNARHHGVEKRIAFAQGNWFEKVDGVFDLVVSNPPYIPQDDIANLDPEVKNHDPILALSGGEDGLDAYRTILTETKIHLKPGGFLFFEMGINQEKQMARLVEDSGANLSRIIPDLAGIPRVAEISYGDK